MPARKLLAYAAIYFLWGGSFLAIREIVGGAGGAAVPPFFAAGFRFTLAGAFLILWSRARGRTALTARQLASAAMLGFVMFACLYAPLFWAETRIASGVAAIISAMIPLWIFAGELFVLRSQRATPLAAGGIVLGLGGVVLLTLGPGANSHGSGPHGAGAHSPALAIVLTLAGTVSWSAGTLASRRLTLPQPQKANAGWQMFLGGLMLLALSAAAGDFARLPPMPALLSARVAGSMAYLIIAASIIAYTAYVWLIAHDVPTRVSSYAYVNPVIALLLGAAFAGERLRPGQMAGAALVVTGVLATLQARSAHASSDSAHSCDPAAVSEPS
ncbi:MAG TPA: EamA family transporter [Acidobacteriaceae bacterium]